MNKKFYQKALLALATCLTTLGLQAQVFWSEDFSDNSVPAGWGNENTEATGGLWLWTNDPAQPAFGAQQPFGAPSAANGYVYFNSDDLGPVDFDARLTTTVIDCSNWATVNLTFHAQYSDATAASKAYVGVSTDGVNYNYHEVHASVPTNNLSNTDLITELNITADAAMQSTVYLQFRWTGNYEYGWEIDDVELEGAPVPDPVQFWSEDFAGGIPADWTNEEVTPANAVWEWTNDPAQPAYGAQQPFGAPTAANGYVFFDSDALGGVNPDHDARLTTAAINCSGVGSVMLKFHAQYADATAGAKAYVGVSTDGVTFDYTEVLGNIPTNNLSSVDEFVELDLSSVAGESAVYLQFRFVGNYEYGFEVDDIGLWTTPLGPCAVGPTPDFLDYGMYPGADTTNGMDATLGITEMACANSFFEYTFTVAIPDSAMFDDVAGAPITLMTEDFAGGIPANWTNEEVTPANAVWEYSSDPALPNYGPQPAFAAPTAANGFAFFNSDALGGVNPNHDARLTTAAIDCSNASNVQVEFHAQYAYSSPDGKAYVGVSNDGVNFTYTQVLTMVPSNNLQETDRLVTVDISGVADGQAMVYVQFKFEGNYEYGLEIDDILVSGEGAGTSGGQAEINMLTLNNVVGLPAGITYACDPPSCVFPGGMLGCLTISGTESVAGDYAISFEGTTNTDLGDFPAVYPTGNGEYVLHVNPSYNNTTTTRICEGETFAFGAINADMTGMYYDTVFTAMGCDSISILDLTVDPIYNVPQTASICEGESIVLGGAAQTTAGQYTDVLASINGCDSIIVTDLTVRPLSSSVIDTVVIEGQSIMIDGNEVSTAGTVMVTETGFNGCDSTITWNVTIIVATENTVLGVNNFSVQPNPVNGQARISVELVQAGDVMIELYDMLGRQVEVIENNTLGSGVHNYRFNSEHLEEQVYLLKFTVGDQIYTKRLVVLR